MAHEIAVVGHVARDRVSIGGRQWDAPGGVPVYAGSVYLRLGRSTTIVTKAAASDSASLLDDLRALGARVVCGRSRETTAFENVVARDFGRREQRIASIADPFTEDDLEAIDAPVVHLGPLSFGELPPLIVQSVAKRAEFVALDVQGTLRAARLGPVRFANGGLAEMAPYMNVVKADRTEGVAVTGEIDPEVIVAKLAELGARETILTLSAKGALLRVDGQTHEVAPYPARRVVDPTGAGDSFLAGYVSARCGGHSPLEAARFASAVATLAIEAEGPFRGDEAAVRRLEADA